MKYTSEQIETHLESEPLIVPPVLAKTELSMHPVLRVVWETARSKLIEATEVVFVGYSLPETDLAARTLFRETLQERVDVRIRVVGAGTSNEQARTVDSYRTLFPGLRDDDFDFSGALECLGREYVDAQPESGPW